MLSARSDKRPSAVPGAPARAASGRRSTPCACGGGCPKCRSRQAAAGVAETARPARVERPDGLLANIPTYLPHEPDDRLRGFGAPLDSSLDDKEDEKDEDANGSPPDQCHACAEERVPGAAPACEDGWFSARSPRGEGPGVRPPLEAGWFTGDWYKTKNTIICDGSGSLTINEATSYKHGVQECTRLHEGQHRTDWYARYGNDICKDRAKGDLPYFTPAGKSSYKDFLKTSECAAWKIGRDCRQEKLAACKSDDCKTDVQKKVNWANNRVKHYCG